MDQKDEFNKWMQAIEEALSGEKQIVERMPVTNECGCGSWDCPQCFPEQDQSPNGAKPAVIAAVGQRCPACGSGTDVCPACGQTHINANGQMSPMSIPPSEPEFDGELEELSEPTINSYRDKAIGQYNGLASNLNTSDDYATLDNREAGIRRANDRLGLDSGDFDLDTGNDYFDEPDISNPADLSPYGGRHNDYFSTVHARGLEEEEPEMPDAPAERPSNGKAGVKLGHIVQSFEPIGNDSESPFTNGNDNLDEGEIEPTDDELRDIESSSDPFVNPMAQNPDVDTIMYMQAMGLSMSDVHYDERELYTLTPEQLKKVKAEVLGGQTEPGPAVQEDEMQDAAPMPAPTQGMNPGGVGSGGIGNYPPGTAPTMPESIQHNNDTGWYVITREGYAVDGPYPSKEEAQMSVEDGEHVRYGQPANDGTSRIKPMSPNPFGNLKENTMENVDKDVARIMKGFSQYDALKASKAIVSEKSAFDWDEKKKEDEKNDEKTTKTHKGGEVTKTDTGLKHKGTYGGEKEVKESTEVDAEILEWMQRFAKLGKMG